MPTRRRVISAIAVVVLFPLLSIVGAAVGIAGSSTSSADVPGAALPFQQFELNDAGGRAWNAYNRSEGVDGPTVIGRPSAVAAVVGGDEYVFARAADSDLVQYVDSQPGGDAWSSEDVTSVAEAGPALGSDPAAIYDSGDGLLHVYAEAANGDLVEYVDSDRDGHLWWAWDLSSSAGGGAAVNGTPSALYDPADQLIHVYVRSSDGHLVEYVDNNLDGHGWNVTDLSSGAPGGSPVAGTPSAIYDPAQAEVHVYVESSGGALVEYVDSDRDGHPWWAWNLTSAAVGGVGLGDTPAALFDPLDGDLHIYVESAGGYLMEYVDSDRDGHPWWAWNLTGAAEGGGIVAGSPSVLFNAADGFVHVYVRSSANNLTEYVDSNRDGHPWWAWNLTSGSAGPTIGSDPSASVTGGMLQVFAGGPLAPGGPPRTGVGVYGFASWSAASTAIREGWPILGDTGGLGTMGPPYVAQLVSQPDLNIGTAIVELQTRETWLSFWTVSGPADGQPSCGGTAPVTHDTWYSAAYQAGQYAAQTIDADARIDATKPDYLILDPEGCNYDDGTGPPTPTDFSQFIGGWAAGVRSVDPSLHPGFYANQSEYADNDLAAIDLPAFVAVSPILGNQPFPPGGPYGSPGANVLGYIEYFGGCPAAPYENTVRGWGEPYNTIQFGDSGVDCGP